MHIMIKGHFIASYFSIWCSPLISYVCALFMPRSTKLRYWRRLRCRSSHPSVQPSISLSTFRFLSRYLKPAGGISFILHIHIPLGDVDVPFEFFELRLFNFIMHDIWQLIVSGVDLGNPGGGGDFFHIAHTHPLGGADVPVGVYEL